MILGALGCGAGFCGVLWGRAFLGLGLGFTFRDLCDFDLWRLGADLTQLWVLLVVFWVFSLLLCALCLF